MTNLGNRLLDQRNGNIIHSSRLTEEDAQAKIHDDADRRKEEEKTNWVALHLRSQILQLPKWKTPNPATVPNLKDCCQEIPCQLDLIFRCLLCGLKQETQLDDQKETVDRKVTAMESDAI